ncbi:hypothetical protein C8F04DRAFT_1033044 [Mycena alexandri]|uniref:F-box domain-containing protein n=1 Tax=Mycena alexandri TaxID=1745969 RepID=A0AAD6X5J7_9AGAR|nr:hypothetical protein C8F04DRAFT_1033044 [Mycena alexandri]
MTLESPFTSRLGTNYCARDEEVREIQRLIQEPLSHLKRLDEQIAELQKSISSLTEEHNSVSAYVYAHRALLSPIRRLDADVLQEIFVACLPTHRNCVMTAREAPVLLGRICSSWRALSLSTPRLWASLHIAEPLTQRSWGSQIPAHEEVRAELHARRIEISQTWLGRSGQLPLSLSLECGLSDEEVPAFRLPTALQALIPFATRWQHVALAVSSCTLDLLFNLTEADVPLLRTLEITQLFLSQDVEWQSFALLRGPRITSFALTRAGSNTYPLALPLQWENLTSFSLIGRTWSDMHPLTTTIALEILDRCPRLQICNLLLKDDTVPAVSDRAVLELPHLLSLDIICTAGLPIFTPGLIFGSLSLPELRRLTFRDSGNFRGDLSFPFLSVSPRLECLEIDAQIFGRESVVEFSRALPATIQQLHFTGYDSVAMRGIPFFDDALAVLTPSPTQPNVGCPILRELSITCSANLSDDALLRFITARMAARPAALRRVEIQFNREKQLEMQPDLQPFVDAGLEVFTTYIERPHTSEFSAWRGLADGPNADMNSLF